MLEHQFWLMEQYKPPNTIHRCILRLHYRDTNNNNHFLFQLPFAAQLATETNSKRLEYTSPASTCLSTLLIRNHVLQNSRN
jgi:hypothetical protein